MKKLFQILAMTGTALLLVVLTPDLTFAAEPTALDEVESALGAMVGIFIRTLNLFLWPFLLVVGSLMDNDLILGPGMVDRLLGIWVQVRNLVNIVFAIVLLVIAFYNALPFSSGEDNLAIKTALPKVVLGLILVNFTFLGGRLVLDVTNVATTAAFGLTTVVDNYDFDQTKETFIKNVCVKSDGSHWNINNPKDKDNIPTTTELFCAFDVEHGEYLGELNPVIEVNYFSKLNQNNIALIMATNMGALESLPLLKEEAIVDLSGLVINSIFSLVMYVVFAISFVVLGIMLLTRIAVMWIALALSPIAALLYAVPQLGDALGSGGGDLSGKVTKQLLAPVIIAITLSIGFLMLDALNQVGSSFHELGELKVDQLLTSDYLISGITDLEQLIISIATVVIVWTGIFAAAEGTIAQGATDAIKGLGEKVGGTLAKAPFLIPTIPVPIQGGDKFKNWSPLTMIQTLDSGLDALKFNYMAKDQIEGTFAEKMFGAGGRGNAMTRSNDILALLGSGSSIAAKDIQEVARHLMQSVSQDSTLDKDEKDKLINRLRSASNNLNAATTLNELKAILNEHGMDAAKVLGLNTNEFSKIQDRLVDIKEIARPEEKKPTGEANSEGKAKEAPLLNTFVPIDLDAQALDDSIKNKLTTAKITEINQGETAEAFVKRVNDAVEADTDIADKEAAKLTEQEQTAIETLLKTPPTQP